MMRFLGVLLKISMLAGMTMGVVVGCSGTSAPTDRADCPRVVLDRATSSLTRFRETVGRDLTDLELEAEIIGYTGTCDHDRDHVSMTLAVRFIATRGPALEDSTVTWPYFIAVVQTPPSATLPPSETAAQPTILVPKILVKEVFRLASTFPPGQDSIHVRDEDITLALPLRPEESLDRYQIFLGLQLTPEQLNDNRRKPRTGG
ncbi:MAG: hypothetical protein FD149_2052 [Rhodospirillaceae bacterium]|nr:MAG: hypothetical protein FD149_2052 [Rhodospirillaceae bacterium]